MDEKYFCRTCKGLRNHKQLYEVKRSGDDNDGHFHWINSYLMIECLGCETISFLEIYGDTEMINYGDEGETDYYYDKTVYPYYLERDELEHTDFIPAVIRTIYKETISSFKADSKILTAGGLRAIIEATCNHLKIRKGSLEKRIDLLHQGGYLTLNESKRLHSIRFLGNDALHEIEMPKKHQLNVLLDIVNHLLSSLFINDRIIRGKVDTVIDEYNDFVKLVENKITNDMIGHEYTIEEIVGKSKRRILTSIYKEFVDKFKKEAEESKYNFVTVRVTKQKFAFKIVNVPGFVSYM